MPISRSLATDCCVGLVFSSPAALMKGTKVTWTKMALLWPDFEREFADGLQERQALDVAGRAADLGDDHVGLGLLGQHVDAAS